jgi:hypothetical protein
MPKQPMLVGEKSAERNTLRYCGCDDFSVF